MKKRRRNSLPRTTLEIFRSLGLRVRPVDERSREWLSYQRGIVKLAGRDERPLTDPQKRALARRRVELRREVGHSKEPEWKLLAKFNKRQVASARKRAKTDRVLQRLAKLPRTAGDVVFIPDDPRAAHKRFLNYDEFAKFMTLPHYEKDRAALLAKGKFVVGMINSDTGELYKRKSGKPKYRTVLIKGDIHGQQEKKRKRVGGKTNRRTREGKSAARKQGTHRKARKK